MVAQQRSLNMRNDLETCHVQRFKAETELEAAQQKILELELKIVSLEDEIKFINKEWTAEVRDYEEQLRWERMRDDY